MEILRKLNKIFSKQQKIKFFLLLVVMFIGSLLEAAGVSLIMPFMSVVTNPDLIRSNRILVEVNHFLHLNSASQFLLFLCLVMIVVYVFKNLFLMFMYYFQYRFTFNNQMRMSTRLLECYMHKPFTFHLQKNSAEILRSVTDDVNKLFALVLSTILLISEIFVALMVSILLFLIDPVITAIVLASLALSMGVFFAIFKKRIKIYGLEAQRFLGQMLKWINQAIGGLKEIKINQREAFFVDAFHANGMGYVKAIKRGSFVNQLPRLIIETICVCGILVVVAFILYSNGEIESIVPKISTFAMAAFRLLPSASRMNSYVSSILLYKSSIDLIHHDLSEAGEFTETPVKVREQMNLKKVEKIEMENISYGYPNSTEKVLENLNLKIPIGKSIAIIGPSGSGKTTFVDLLLGLFTPNQGVIRFNDLNLHENLDIWSQKVGYIPQNIYLSDDSIKNNVAFGVKEEFIEEHKVWEALKKAQIDEFVRKKPDGLNSIIGERGINLSGGQKQRIGIARALYHDPEILVLDEATSALDKETEKAIMDAIEALRGKMTLVIIAHRLTTIENCDIVYELQNKNLKLRNQK